MKKKLISLLLASAMAVGVLAGCGQAQESTEATVEEKTEASATQDTAAESDDKAEEEVPQELVTIKMLARNMHWGDLEGKMWADYAPGKALQEDLAELGLALEIEFVEETDWENVLNTRMASQNDLPDLIANS